MKQLVTRRQILHDTILCGIPRTVKLIETESKTGVCQLARSREKQGVIVWCVQFQFHKMK
jgi:hypothetical protein